MKACQLFSLRNAHLGACELVITHLIEIINYQVSYIIALSDAHVLEMRPINILQFEQLKTFEKLAKERKFATNCKSIGKAVEKTLEKHWENIAKALQKHLKNIGKTLGKHWKNIAKTLQSIGKALHALQK